MREENGYKGPVVGGKATPSRIGEKGSKAEAIEQVGEQHRVGTVWEETRL